MHVKYIQEAFDFIYEARPEPESLLGVVRSLLEAKSELVADRHGANILRFALETWLEIADLNSCGTTTWTRTCRNLIFAIKSWTAGPYADRVIVSLISGPAPTDIRDKLYAEATARSDLFRGLVKPMGKQYATIYMRELLTPAAAKNMDHEEKAAAIEAGWITFVMDDLPRLIAAIAEMVTCRRRQ